MLSRGQWSGFGRRARESEVSNATESFIDSVVDQEPITPDQVREYRWMAKQSRRAGVAFGHMSRKDARYVKAQDRAELGTLMKHAKRYKRTGKMPGER